MHKLFCCRLLIVVAAPLLLGATKKDDKPPLDAATILKGIKNPHNFEVSVFALPPQVMYPTALAATPTGELFVAIDEQGSLGKEKGKGRVVKCVDTNGDGQADQFTTFAVMDHPRGLFYDIATRTLTVLHPPFITAYIDSTGDGVADKTTLLATGIANEKVQQQRGADHTTNGFRVGIDGWLYIAQGDYGSVKAVGVKDDSQYVRHGGGVSRIRLDGTGLEVFSNGQRNICDVAVSPLLDVFTRDNTNDGGGWDVRLSHVVPTGEYGYPRLFKNSPDEIVQPIAVYGGGSPVGALFLDEPGFPGDFGRALYTVEWGRSAVFKHALAADGSTFKETAKPVELVGVPRAIDMDADAQGHLYVASWINGGFAYSGDNVGYVARLTPRGGSAGRFPDMAKLSEDALVQLIASPSAVTRQYAQREILARGPQSAAAVAPALEKLAGAKGALEGRVAAIFTLKQLIREKSNDALVRLAGDPEVREFALRALSDVRGDSTVPAEPFVAALTDPNPRVRLVAAWGLSRLNQRAAADRLLPLVADGDAAVAHVAINAMTSLGASGPALGAVDSPNAALAAAALRVLQGLHESQVVEALADKLKSTTDLERRALLYKTLCRLHFKEAPYDGSWWGTRPDTSGPYYKTAEWEGSARIKSLLITAISSEKPQVVKSLLITMQKNKIDFPELSAALQKLAAQDPTFKAVLMELMAGRRTLNREQVVLLTSTVASDQDAPALRVQATRTLLALSNQREVVEAALPVLYGTSSQAAVPAELAAAINEFLRDSRLLQHSAALAKLTQSSEAARRDAAWLVLVHLANNKLLQKDTKNNNLALVNKTVEEAFGKPERAVVLLQAIRAAKADSFHTRLTVLASGSDPQVAAAAKDALAAVASASSASTGPLIETMKYEQVVEAAMRSKGDPTVGKELFTKVGCVQCHTVAASEPPKGPFLGGIAARYNRGELCESILRPSAKIAQGFDTQWFTTHDDDEYEGFVTREAGDEVEIRNILGVTSVIKKKDVKERGKRELSVMPEGLMAKFTSTDVANLLAYLESLKLK